MRKEFLATEEARYNARMNQRKKIQKVRRGNNWSLAIDFIIRTGITILFWWGNTWLGLVTVIFLWLPVLIEVISPEKIIINPPFTTVRGNPDCPVCKGRYFINQGVLGYWLGWKECTNCTARREFKPINQAERS